jgi:hypothetical protein
VTERRVTASVFLFAAIIIVCSLMILQLTHAKLPKAFTPEKPVEYTELQSEGSSVRAIVKGSIYQTGSNMTVFGVCQDGDGYLLPAATTQFSAWYPNMTAVVTNASMIGDGDGRWRIHVVMPATIGTYFTEMRCTYAGDFGLAYGEWQNPEWVALLGATYDVVFGVNASTVLLESVVQNLSFDVDAYFATVQQNVSEIIALIQGANVTYNLSVNVTANTTNLEERFREVSRALSWLRDGRWLIDGMNPTYIPGSGNTTYRGVDVRARDAVAVAGDGGVFGQWDGVSWSFGVTPGVVDWMSTSLVGRTQWCFGGNITPTTTMIFLTPGVSQPLYGVCSGTPAMIPGTNATYVAHGVAYADPRDPFGPAQFWVVLDTGEVKESVDQGASWSTVTTLAAQGRGSVCGQWTDVERYAVGGASVYANGSMLTVSGAVFTDVACVGNGVAYVVGMNMTTNRTSVWKYVRGSIVAVAEFNEIPAAGIAASNEDVVWVALQYGGGIVQYDGVQWSMRESTTLGALTNISIMLGNATNATAQALFAVGSSGYGAYAVGTDGLIVRRYGIDEEAILGNGGGGGMFNGTVGFNGTVEFNGTVNVTVVFNESEILEALAAANASLTQEIAAVQGWLVQWNTSVMERFDAIAGNQTLLQLAVGDVQSGVTQILIQLGILQEQVNQTLQIANQTLQIANETRSDVQLLVNRSGQLRAWTTI